MVGPRTGMSIGGSGATPVNTLYGGGGGAGFALPMLPALPPNPPAGPTPLPDPTPSQSPPYPPPAFPPPAVSSGPPTTTVALAATSPALSGRRPARLPGIDLDRAVNVDRAATVAAALATAAKGNPFTSRGGRRPSGKGSAAQRARAGAGPGAGADGTGAAGGDYATGGAAPSAETEPGVEASSSSRGPAGNSKKVRSHPTSFSAAGARKSQPVDHPVCFTFRLWNTRWNSPPPPRPVTNVFGFYRGVALIRRLDTPMAPPRPGPCSPRIPLCHVE